MNLNDISYDMSTVYSYIANMSPYYSWGAPRLVSANQLSQRYPVYKDLFEQIAGNQNSSASQGVRLDAWVKGINDNISTDPITVYRYLRSTLNRTNEYINPYVNTPPWARKIFGEVWEKNPDFSLVTPNSPPNPTPFYDYARNKINEFEKSAQVQINAFASGALRPEEFAANGKAYTANKIDVGTLDASQGGTPFAKITAKDRFGATEEFVFVPESYMMKGQRVGDRTYINENFLNKDFLSNLNSFTLFNRVFSDQTLGGQKVLSNGAVKGMIDNFGANGFLISQKDIQSKFPKIANSLFENQGYIGDVVLSSGETKQREAQLVSFAGELAYKTTGYLTYTRINYISIGYGPPLVYPTIIPNASMDAYFTGKDYGNEFSYQKMGSGYASQKGFFVYDTINLIPEPTKPNWGAFIATAAGMYLAGSGLMAAISTASGAAATTSFATTVGQAIGLTGTAAAVTGGALIGASIYGLAGEDPLTGALVGGIGEFAATANYAEPVGRALGATTTSTAVVVGNVAISAALSGLKAAALGQDVGKSMLAGGVVGGLQAASADIANTLLGGQENVEKLANSLGFYGARGLAQVQSIIATSLAQGIVAEISESRPFGEAVAQSLIANGVSTRVANEVVAGFAQDTPTTRAVFNATRQMTSVAATAAMNNQNINEALEMAAPEIILTTFRTITTPDQEIADEVAQEQAPEGVEVAGEITPEMLSRLQSMPLTGEQVIRDEMAEEDGIRFNYRVIRGFRSDGSTYQYEINTFDSGRVIYTTIIDGEIKLFETRPDLKNSAPGVGDVPVDEEVSQPGESTGQPGGTTAPPPALETVDTGTTAPPAVDTGTTVPPSTGTGTEGAPPIDTGAGTVPQPAIPPESTILLDLRQYGSGSPTSPNAAVLSRGGLGTGGADEDVSFIFVGQESGTNNEQYSVNGKVYTLYVLPNRQVLISDQTPNEVIFVELDQTRNIPKITPVDVATVPADVQTQIEDKQIEREILKQQIGGSPQEQPAGAEGATGGEATGGGAPGGGEPTDTGAPTQPTEQEEQPPVDTDATLPPIEGDITLPPAGGETGEVGPTEPGEGEVEEQLPPGDENISDEDLLDLIRDELFGPGAGEEEGEGEEEGAGPGTGEEGEGPGAGEEGEGISGGGEGVGVEGEGEGPDTGEGEGTTTPTETDTNIRPSIVSILRRPPTRAGESAPYRVTGMDESGILGRKQPLFGGDEDLQRAEWNRRSLRLKRLLGL